MSRWTNVQAVPIISGEAYNQDVGDRQMSKQTNADWLRRALANAKEDHAVF